MKNRKPLLLTLAVFAGVMLLVVAAALFWRGRGGARYRNGNVPYPYEWAERQNGSVLLKLDGSTAPEGVWSASGASGDVVSVAACETKKGKASVTLLPASAGCEALTFTLRSGEERLAEMELTVETTERNGSLAVTVIDHGERAWQNAVNGGDEKHPYTARTDEYGSLVLHIADAGESEAERWSATSSDDLIASVLDLQTTEDGIDAYLDTHVDGSAEITVSGEAANLTYVFTVTAESGALRLKDSKWSEYVPPAGMTDEEMEKALSGIADMLESLKP